MATSSPTPRLLKDFLQDQTTDTRKTRFHKATEVFINAVKFLPFKSFRPPSFLPRSISRRLSRSHTNRETQTNHYENILTEFSITVKVKDILRWKSFLDLTEEQEIVPPPTEMAAASCRETAAWPPSLCTTTGTSSNSGRSSWCDSDFTAEDLPSCFGESEELSSENEIELKSEKCLPVKTDGLDTRTGLKKEEVLHEAEESHTPISVLDFSYRENEELYYFHIPTIKIKEPKIKNTLQNRVFVDEEEKRNEEKANELANCAIATCPVRGCVASVDYCLISDFFKQELITNKNSNKTNQFELENVMRMAKAWLRGEDEGSLEWEMEGKREICVREMERKEKWNKFEEEQEEMIVTIEIMLLNSLLDELLIDFISH